MFKYLSNLKLLMAGLNFTWGIIIGILILPVLFLIFVLYLYLKDKVEDFLHKKKYKNNAASKPNSNATAQVNADNNQKKEHQHDNNDDHHEHHAAEQKENLIKIEEEDFENKKV